ncbi:MAG TPA: 23S rRNA (uracil(1939)-C(5))-methyltransferase RlmD [Solirubrobacteraceae bacterium]|jgi:23S rRNA (uracil1939-C5)-methyltransferase|nr:23S rRNA (uracil(1939)-C(5))-methyltransferase RlmD [Solirubrobacteraceae bacterium]
MSTSPDLEQAIDTAADGFQRPQRGEELELQIESLAFGGEGIARIGDGGYVVFVADAIPGDRVRAVVHKRKRSYAHARTVEVLQQSPERIAPVANHPGVPWQVLPYERQLQIKHEQVGEALRRIGHLEGFELQEIVPAVEQWRYRNKLEYSFGDEGGELVCGFHAPAGANSVLAIEDCMLASERGNLARELALAWCRAEGLTAWDRGRRSGAGPAGRRGGHRREERIGPAPDGRAQLRNLVVREGRRSGQLQIRIVTSEGELEAGSFAAALSQGLGETLSGVLWTRSGSLAETTAGGETELVWGEGKLPERLGELELQISAEAFFQTNTEMAERLYGLVVEFAALEGWERVYDLYSGIGSIALTLAPRAGELWGIELIEPAVADAIAGARANEVTKANFFAGDVRLALPELLERAGRPDVLVVDPPRAGLSKKVVHRIIDASPKRIVYVSCNPTTLAPNAAELVEAGWTLRKVRPVDMFPQTHHIECVALFERG